MRITVSYPYPSGLQILYGLQKIYATELLYFFNISALFSIMVLTVYSDKN